MADKGFHSALTVTNVKSLIPITLDMETAQYHEWATLFKVLASVHSVLGILSHLLTLLNLLPTMKPRQPTYISGNG